MKELLMIAAVVVIWVLINKFVLPKMGLPG